MLESYIEFESLNIDFSDIPSFDEFGEDMVESRAVLIGRRMAQNQKIWTRNHQKWLELFQNPYFVFAENAKNNDKNIIEIYSRSCRADNLIQYSSFIRTRSGKLDAIRHVDICIDDLEAFEESIYAQDCLVDSIFAYFQNPSNVNKESSD